MAIQIGDRVRFHFVISHVCGGADACTCEATESNTRPAAVATIHPPDDGAQALDLDVEFEPSDFSDAFSPTMRQSSVRQAKRQVPESGSWTPDLPV